MFKKTELKLNIGCGLNTPENWINIDNSFSAKLAKYPLVKKILYKTRILPKRLYELSWPNNIMICDLRKRLPFEDGTVKHIYSSHLFEHLTRGDAEFLIRECYRVLTHQGVIRIIVPDLKSKIEIYINRMKHIEGQAENGNVAPADEFLEGLRLYDSSDESIPFWIRLTRVLQGNKNLHKWLYDFHSLSSKLKKHGFVGIVRKDYLDSQIEDVSQLDNIKRFRFGLCIEANKE